MPNIPPDKVSKVLNGIEHSIRKYENDIAVADQKCSEGNKEQRKHRRTRAADFRNNFRVYTEGIKPTMDSLSTTINSMSDGEDKQSAVAKHSSVATMLQGGSSSAQATASDRAIQAEHSANRGSAVEGDGTFDARTDQQRYGG